MAQGRFAEAAALLRPALATQERLFGTDSAEPVQSRFLLGMALLGSPDGDLREAGALMNGARAGLLRQFGPRHRLTLVANATWGHIASMGFGEHAAGLEAIRFATLQLRAIAADSAVNAQAAREFEDMRNTFAYEVAASWRLAAGANPP